MARTLRYTITVHDNLQNAQDVFTTNSASIRRCIGEPTCRFYDMDFKGAQILDRDRPAPDAPKLDAADRTLDEMNDRIAQLFELYGKLDKQVGELERMGARDCERTYSIFKSIRDEINEGLGIGED